MSGQRPPMAWFTGAYILRALSLAHVRVWEAAGRGYHTPASPGIAHFVWFSYVNRALFGISTSADRWPGAALCRASRDTAAAVTRWLPDGRALAGGYQEVAASSRGQPSGPTVAGLPTAAAGTRTGRSSSSRPSRRRTSTVRASRPPTRRTRTVGARVRSRMRACTTLRARVSGCLLSARS
jgi:hypothetical protein